MTKFTTTLPRDFDDTYLERAKIINIPEPYQFFKYRVIDEVKILCKVLKAARHEPFLLLFSSRGRFKPELIAIFIISFWMLRQKPRIALYGEMFQPNKGIQGHLERLLMQRIDKAVTQYILASEGEIPLFSNLWGVKKEKIQVCFEYTRASTVIDQANDVKDFIFAGGSSFRDFEPLLQAAKEFPQQKFVFCTPKLLDHEDLPDNVWAGLVSKEEYSRLIKQAKIVIVPISLEVKRIVGVLTYLEAMALNKLVVVPNVVGASEYIIDKKSGLIVDGSKQDYVSAIEWATSPLNQDHVKAIEENAYLRATQNFSRKNHIKQLFRLIDEMADPVVEKPIPSNSINYSKTS